MSVGICSISFRNLSVEELIAKCVECGIESIEWGGDVHVPPVDLLNAKRVGELSKKAGLNVPSYGSYYRLDGGDFESVSKAAEALGASVIRVWAGSKDSEEFTAEEYEKLLAEVRRCADIAAARGQKVCFEYHMCTYCNHAHSAKKLIEDSGKANIGTYWQPMYWYFGKTDDAFSDNIASIKQLLPYIENVHVYNWVNRERLTLDGALDEWRAYADILGERNYYLEFMPRNELSLVCGEAAALRKILAK